MTSLTEFGLSSYEDQAYRALLATGRAPARTVAERSGVPEGRIYDVLDGLASRDLVRVRAGEPRLYDPVGPESAVETLLDDRLSALDAEAERYRALAAEARESLAPTPPTAGNVWLSAFDDPDALTLIGEMLANVDDRFAMAVGRPYRDVSVEAYREEVGAFLEHFPTDATVDLLLEESLVEVFAAEIAALAPGDGDVSVRRLPGIELTVEVVDGTTAYVDVPHPFEAGRRAGFVEIREPAVAAEFDALFEEAWAAAKSV